jgi:twinkle protein
VALALPQLRLLRRFIRSTRMDRAAGLDPALAEKFGISTKREGGANWIAVPYVERGQVDQPQVPAGVGKAAPDGRRGAADPVEPRRAAEQSSQPLIITEGEWDALAAIQSGFSRCVSVPNGAPQQSDGEPEEAKRYEFLWRSKDLLDKVERIHHCDRQRRAGRILAADLARWFGPERCKFIEYPEAAGTKDLNEVLLSYGARRGARVLDSRQALPGQGPLPA